MFDVFLSNKAAKEFRCTDKKILEKIKALLKTLENYPLPVKEYDLKKISGTESFYRIRLSARRVVYSVDWDNRTINVLKIEKRDDSTYDGI